jgi:hypothetical protein
MVSLDSFEWLTRGCAGKNLTSNMMHGMIVVRTNASLQFLMYAMTNPEMKMEIIETWVKSTGLSGDRQWHVRYPKARQEGGESSTYGNWNFVRDSFLDQMRIPAKRHECGSEPQRISSTIEHVGNGMLTL